jgi:hypothetical protein
VADNPPHFKRVLDLNHPWVGCRDGALVMRKWFPGGRGAEWTCFATTILEYEFRKLPDGTLEVRRDEKVWRCSMRGQPDRKSQKMYLFPPAL